MAEDKNRVDRIFELKRLRQEVRAEYRNEGLAEGKSEEKLEIARKMKAAGRPLTEIEQFTGLAPEAIAQL